MNNTAIEFDKVVKSFDSQVAVDKISFSVERGPLVTLLGPSGCGKTTTLRMLAGLELPTSGQILINGTDVSRCPAFERNVGMVFQSYALFPHMTVMENVCYGLQSQKMPNEAARIKADLALEKVGLTGLSGRYPSELSGGQQQRVAIARSIVMESEVLLFDEPLSNLDAKLRRKVRADIRALQQDLDVTSVYVTHDQEEAMAISDEVIVMDAGRMHKKEHPRICTVFQRTHLSRSLSARPICWKLWWNTPTCIYRVLRSF